jgi:hypothetical protein
MAGGAAACLYRRMHGFLHGETLVALKAEYRRLLNQRYCGFPAPWMVSGLFVAIQTTHFRYRFMELCQTFQPGMACEEAAGTFSI